MQGPIQCDRELYIFTNL